MKININHIGFFAKQVLDRPERALVSGIASRGIYLQPKNDWTLYLSQENFCGPLTLNLEDESARLNKINAGCVVQYNPQEINFPDDNITISLEGSNIWHPPQIDKEYKFLPEHLDSIHSHINQITPENPYLPLLSKNPENIPGVAVIGERILNFQNSLITGNLERISEGAIKLLGLGPGLTPLGDDFLLGVLLTLNRWGHVLSIPQSKAQKDKPISYPSHLVNNLNQIILENTQLKTTRISSALLACAVEGAADERLLKVLDGLCCGEEITQNDVRNLLRWGNSSGITVLAGIITVLNS